MLTQYSASNVAERTQEIHRILFTMGLEKKTGRMSLKEEVFVRDMAERLNTFGDKAMTTPNQLFWMRDLKDKYL